MNRTKEFPLSETTKEVLKRLAGHPDWSFEAFEYTEFGVPTSVVFKVEMPFNKKQEAGLRK